MQAIDVLDETGARVRLRESSILPEEAKEAQNKLKEVMTSKEKLPAPHGAKTCLLLRPRAFACHFCRPCEEEAVRNQNYELAQELKTEDAAMKNRKHRVKHHTGTKT